MAKSTFNMVYGSPTSIWGLEDSCVLISWIFLCFSYHDMEFSPYFIHLFFFLYHDILLHFSVLPKTIILVCVTE